MKIRTKILGGFMVVAFVGAMIGAIGFITSRMLSGAASEMHRLQLENASISNVLNAHYLWRQGITEATLNGTEFTGSLDSDTCALGQWHNSEAARGMDDPELLRMLAELDVPHDYIHTEARVVADYISAGDLASARQYLNENILPTTQEVIAILTDMQARYTLLTEEKDTETTRIETLVSFLNAALVVTAVAAGTLFALLIANMVSRPLAVLTSFMNRASGTGELELSQEDRALIEKYSLKKDELGQVISATASFAGRITETGKVLEQVADGDLTAELPLLSDRDTMGLSLKKMTDSLNDMFGGINTASAQVSTGASQVADGAQALASGATEQAASIEELSNAISEINEMSKANTKSATSSLGDVRRAGELMGVCTEQMDRMTEAMRAIDEKSQNISKTTKMIDDIAFQTNILALNAAVEAARAGQHGKGFAVVAEEVRNLASKSAEAAHETSALIASSSESVREGNRIVEEVNGSLQAVGEISAKNAEQIAGLQSVSVRQSEAMEQVSIGIGQIAQVVQQNSATAEESAAASEEMSGQSAMLSELIARFRLKEGEAARQTPFPEPRPRSAGPAPAGAEEDYGKY